MTEKISVKWLKLIPSVTGHMGIACHPLAEMNTVSVTSWYKKCMTCPRHEKALDKLQLRESARWLAHSLHNHQAIKVKDRLRNAPDWRRTESSGLSEMGVGVRGAGRESQKSYVRKTSPAVAVLQTLIQMRLASHTVSTILLGEAHWLKPPTLTRHYSNLLRELFYNCWVWKRTWGKPAPTGRLWERSKGDITCPTTSENPSHRQPSLLSNVSTTREDPE